MRRPSTAPARAPQPAAAYLDEVLGLLFPGDGGARRGSRRLRGARPDEHELVAIPNADRPKVVVPRRPLRATATAVRNSRSTSSPRVAAALLAAGVAARLGAADLLPDRIVVSGGGGRPADILTYLRRELGEDVLVSLLVGPVRATQKPVLQVITPDARTLGFAKVGVSELSRALVRHEAEALTSLAGRGLREVRVPRVLLHGTWQGHEILVQEAFPQHRGGDVDGPRLTAAMVEVARSAGVGERPLAGTPFWQRLRAGVLDAAGAGGATGAALADAVARLEASRGLQPVSLGAWHGDWAPWNMTVGDGAVKVWDWETYAEGMPLGFDRLHFGLQSDVVLKEVPPAEAVRRAGRRAAAELAPFGVTEPAARVVLVLYLLHLVAGFAETGETGTRLARLDTWVPEVLPGLVAGCVDGGGVSR